MVPENMHFKGEGPVVSDAWQEGEKAYTPVLTPSPDVILSSGRPDFDARKVFPQFVLDLYTLNVQGRGRDQHGVLWKNGTSNRLQSFVNSIRGIAALILANPKEVEKGQWQAIVESLQHPLIAFIMMQRGEHKNPAMRIGETREYFDGVTRYPQGTLHPRMKQVVDMVNARHEVYGVRDPESGSIYPHMKRAFKYVTMLYVARMVASIARRSRMAASLGSGSAVEDLYNGADGWLGMREAPADMHQFLQVEDGLIEQGNQILSQENPALLAGLKRANHLNAVTSLDAAARMQGISSEWLVQTLRRETRERLSL